MDALAANLHTERLQAVEQQAEVQLQLGLHNQVTTGLPPLVQQFWRREHLRGLLMTALYREQRGPDALILYGRYRDRLRRTGGEPGPALQRLAMQISANDASLLEVDLPPLPHADQAVIASGADPGRQSIARMCAAIITDTPTSGYSTALDRASCITDTTLVDRLRGLEVDSMEFGNRLARACVIHYGIARFLELGALPPAWSSLHKVAQLIRPDTHVVYANRDSPLVSHSRPHLTDADGVEFIEGSLLDTRRLLREPAIRALFQLDKPQDECAPVAIIDQHELNTVSDAHDLKGMYGVLGAQFPAGSLISLTGPSPESLAPQVNEHITEIFGTQSAPEAVHFRTGQRLAELLPDGWQLVPPPAPSASGQNPDGPGHTTYGGRTVSWRSKPATGRRSDEGVASAELTGPLTSAGLGGAAGEPPER